MKLIPTVFADNKKDFDNRFNKLVKISKNIQIDFMDGLFVSARSIPLSQMPDFKKYKNNFEAHLMFSNPINHLEKLRQAGFKKIIFHVETKKPEKTIELIKKEKLIPYLAINPETPVEKTFPYLSRIKGVLFMGVHPGKEHQKFISSVYKKIKLLRSVNKAVRIQVDGGVNFQNVKKFKELGVDFINSGSLISESENPKEVFAKLNSVVKRC